MHLCFLSSSELILLLLPVELGNHPHLPSFLGRIKQDFLIIFVLSSFANLFHGSCPELEVKQQVNTQFFVGNLAEGVWSQLSVVSSIQYLGNGCKGHRWVFHLDDFGDLGPASTVSVTSNHVREVKLLIKLKLPEQVLGLLVEVLVVVSNEELNELTTRLVNKHLLPIGLLEMHDLLVSDNLDLLDNLLDEFISIGFLKTLFSLFHESLSHLKLTFFVGHRQVLLYLCEVLPVWLQTKDGFLSFMELWLLLELVKLL